MVWVSEVGARLHSARNVFLSACREKLGKQYLKSYLWETEKKIQQWSALRDACSPSVDPSNVCQSQIRNCLCHGGLNGLKCRLGEKVQKVYLQNIKRIYTECEGRTGVPGLHRVGWGEFDARSHAPLSHATHNLLLPHNTLLFTPPHFWDSHSCSGSPRTGIKDRTRESIYQERWEIRTWNITRKTWEKVLEPGNTNESSLTVQQWEALNRCLKWWMGVAGYWAAGVLAKSESPQWGGGEEETGESEGEKKQ